MSSYYMEIGSETVYVGYIEGDEGELVPLEEVPGEGSTHWEFGGKPRICEFEDATTVNVNMVRNQLEGM